MAMSKATQEKRFAQLATATLVYTLLVIVWGAFVRVSDSGDGCGTHWPTCQGAVLPPSPTVKTLVELGHRVTSGPILGLMVIGQTIWSFFVFGKGHLARKAAVASLIFTVTEALVGAALVLLRKVARDQSTSRGYWMSGHLVNTLILVATLALVVWAAKRPLTTRLTFFGNGRSGRPARLALAGMVAVVLTSVTGAIAALGDTLFPASSFAEGVKADFDGSAHIFLQLRALHPFAAVVTAILLVAVATMLSQRKLVADESTRLAARRLGLAVFVQMAIGIVNLALAAPMVLQLVHLLFADLLWIALVYTAASAASAPSLEAETNAAAPAAPSAA